ncbi:hypothetical protein Emag_001832 [Eimeria magna]
MDGLVITLGAWSTGIFTGLRRSDTAITRNYAKEAMLSLRFKSVRHQGRETSLYSIQKAGSHHPARSAPSHKSSGPKKKEEIPRHSCPQIFQEEDATQSFVKKKRRLNQPDQRPPGGVSLDETHHPVERSLPQDQIAQARTKGKTARRESGNSAEGRSQKPTAANSLKQGAHAIEQREFMNSGVNKKRKKRGRNSRVKATPGDPVANFGTTEAPSPSNDEEQRREGCSSSEVEQKEENKRVELLHSFAARGVSASGSQSLVERLHGGRFRALNEFLYTREGKEALVKFQNDPKLFDVVRHTYTLVHVLIFLRLPHFK